MVFVTVIEISFKFNLAKHIPLQCLYNYTVSGKVCVT